MEVTLETKVEVSASDDVKMQEVVEWLSGLDGDMNKYASVLQEDGFDSLKAIRTLSKQDLKDLGLRKGHLRILKEGIKELRLQHANETQKEPQS